MNVQRIEIDFPVTVELTQAHQQILNQVLTMICTDYERANPSRVMWAFGQGFKMLANPLALSDDEPIPFDENTYHIEIAEREK